MAEPGAVRTTAATDCAGTAIGSDCSGVGSAALSAVDARLVAALTRFYEERQLPEKLSGVERISRCYAGDRIVDLWAALGLKYNLPPSLTVVWLAGTLDQRTAIQWRRGSVSKCAQRALDNLSMAEAGHQIDSDAGTGRNECPEAGALREAVSAGDIDAASVLAACKGCPQPDLRPRLWRLLLRRRHQACMDDFDGDVMSDPFGFNADEEGSMHTRRDEYARLRERARQAANLGPLLTKVERDADACCSNAAEEFFKSPEVQGAIVRIALTHAWRCSRYVQGTCRIAVVLLFAMACGSTTAPAILEAEAEAFWCLSILVAEANGSLLDGWLYSGQHARILELLRTYDPLLADLLARVGPDTLVKQLSAALLTQVGFALADCARIWDVLLADPQRFGFCDYVVLSLLLGARVPLLEHQEMERFGDRLLAVARRADASELIRISRAVCAFERWCTRGYPVRRPHSVVVLEGVDAAMTAAQTQLTNFWSRVQAVSAEVWDASRSARETAQAALLRAEASAISAMEPEDDIQVSTDQSAQANSERRASFATLSRPVSSTDASYWALAGLEPVTLNPGKVSQPLLTGAMAESLLGYLPVSLRLPGAVEWVLLYTPKEHGVSMSTLYRNASDFSKTVLLVQDAESHVFGGFAPAPWEPRRGVFYGSGEAFVFSFGAFCRDPRLQAFPWTSENNYFMYADNDFLAMGGGEGKSALTVRSDLLHGCSSRTPTFGNPVLAASEEFVVRDLEVWALEEIE